MIDENILLELQLLDADMLLEQLFDSEMLQIVLLIDVEILQIGLLIEVEMLIEKMLVPHAFAEVKIDIDQRIQCRLPNIDAMLHGRVRNKVSKFQYIIANIFLQLALRALDEDTNFDPNLEVVLQGLRQDAIIIATQPRLVQLNAGLGQIESLSLDDA